MENFFGTKLCELRRAGALSQKQLAAELSRRGIKVTNQAISKWESGASLPSAVQFLIICDILDIYDVSGIFYGKSNELISGLNEDGAQRIMEYAALIRNSGLYNNPEVPGPKGTKIRILPVYDLDAAAGTGKLLDLPNYKAVEAGSEVPFNATFGIEVRGESMEPEFHHGEIVWISRQAKLEHGDVGVFIYEGNCHFKRLRDRVGGMRLQCVDSNYPDLIISSPEALVTLGKAIV